MKPRAVWHLPAEAAVSRKLREFVHAAFYNRARACPRHWSLCPLGMGQAPMQWSSRLHAEGGAALYNSVPPALMLSQTSMGWRWSRGGPQATGCQRLFWWCQC